MIVVVLIFWFFFFLLNYAAITRNAANWLRGALGPKIGYPLSCAFCFAWWLALLGFVIYPDWPFWWCLVIPVLHLFLDSAYQKLTGECPPCTEGTK